jgi:hypothetical protein
MVRQPIAGGILLLDAKESLLHSVSKHHMMLQQLRPSDGDHQLLTLTERPQLVNDCTCVRLCGARSCLCCVLLEHGFQLGSQTLVATTPLFVEDL